MVDQMKNVMIGLFIIAATAIIVFILLFLNPSVGNEGQTLRMRFADIDKVSIGTRVTYGGKPVGEVVEITPLFRPGEPREVHNGVVYLYELKVRADSGVRLYDTDDVYLRTSGLLGEKSIEINPTLLSSWQEPVLLNDRVIYAKETGSVEQTFKEFKEVADKFDVALDQISAMVQEIRDKQIVDKVSDTFANLADITKALNNPELWSETLDNVYNVSANLVDSWETVDETLNTASEVADNLRNMTDSGKEIAATIREGEGSLGKIVMRDDFYLDLNSLLSKAETAMDDINHYGILFHTDKSWQRKRARRMNIMNKLESPAEFRNYFNDELCEINTSLSRVHMLLDNEKQTGLCYCNPEFTQVYAELLRRVEKLEDTLQLYNQQMVQMRRQP